MDTLHQFYCSKSWRDLSFNLKVERGGKCDRCDKRPIDRSQLIGHHTIELNTKNMQNPTISLNPDLIEIICLDCHNKEHKRFGHHQKQVYVVWGSPMAGKTTAVRQMMQYGDIVLDLDAIWQAVTFQPEYIKPNNVRYNIFALRDSLMDQIKTRYGQWYDAYIIGGYPEKYERQKLVQDLGAKEIYIASTKQECLQRLYDGDKPREWEKYILDWWEKHERSEYPPLGGQVFKT